MVVLINEVISKLVLMFLVKFCLDFWFWVSVRFVMVGDGGVDGLCVVLVVLVRLSLCVFVRLSVYLVSMLFLMMVCLWV